MSCEKCKDAMTQCNVCGDCFGMCHKELLKKAEAERDALIEQLGIILLRTGEATTEEVVQAARNVMKDKASALAQRDAWGLTHQKDVARIEQLELALEEVLLRDQTNRGSLS